MAIKAPPAPTEIPGREPQFALTVVNAKYAQVDMPCLKKVYAWCLQYKPAFKPQSEWLLTIDPVTNLITHVTEAPKPSTMPGFTVEGDHREASPYVVMSLKTDGSIEIASVPERVPDAVLSEIQDALIAADNEIHVGLKVGRFTVMQKTELPGRTDVYVDHNSR